MAKADVLDDTPTDAEIRTAVRQLKSPRAPGPSKLTAAHMKEWLRDAEEAERLERHAKPGPLPYFLSAQCLFTALKNILN